jgi:hypothetical protein
VKYRIRGTNSSYHSWRVAFGQPHVFVLWVLRQRWSFTGIPGMRGIFSFFFGASAAGAGCFRQGVTDAC